MSSVRLTSMANFLRAAGLEVVEQPGWKTRGNALYGMPDTIVVHHTATSNSAEGDFPTLRLLVEGRSDLPGPLCQIGLSRTGVVHVIASGKANHAGRGEWRGQESSGRTIGIEAENDGSGKPWPVKQLDAYERLCAALCRFLNIGPERVCGHKEWALPAGRKTDPAGIEMNAFRDRVRSHLTPVEPPVTPQKGPSMVIVKNPAGPDQWLAHMGRRWKIASVTELRAYEKVCPRVELDQAGFDRLEVAS